MNDAALQQAIYTRLSNFTALTSGLGTGGIGTKQPQTDTPEDRAAFPYVVFNFAAQGAWDTKTTDGNKVLLNVHMFSRTSSDLARRQAEQPVYDALHKHDFGGNILDCLWRSKSENDDPDGLTKHSTMIFEVTMHDI